MSSDVTHDVSHDELYGVPIARWSSVARFAPDLGERARHSIALDSFDLDILLEPGGRGDLFVILHGAVREIDRYPRFDRVTTTTRRGVPFLCVADPTVGHAGVLLGWYVGTASADPTDAIVEVIRRVQDRLQARRVVLIGGSGGGFAALQLSARLPRSLAFVFSPQTRVIRYYPGPVSNLMTRCFDGMDPTDAEAAHPTRLSALPTYASEPDNVVYYFQNARDPYHVERHFLPFAELFGIGQDGGSTADGRRHFVVEESVEGHGPPSQDRFDVHLDRALAIADEVLPA